MSALMTVPFHGVQLYLVEHEGQPYVPMRPMVEGMGIDWSYQSRKLNASKHRYGVAVIATPSAGGAQESICIPLRKLPGWLGTLEPGRVKSLGARKKIEEFQDECDDALWQYWNDGHAINPRLQQVTFARLSDQACNGQPINHPLNSGLCRPPSEEVAAEYSATSACEKSQLIHATSFIDGRLWNGHAERFLMAGSHDA